MKKFVLCVRDVCADMYINPFMVPNVNLAIRDFHDTIKNPQSGPMHAHPEHFELVKLGTFDDNTGLYDTHNPEQVAVGSASPAVN